MNCTRSSARRRGRQHRRQQRAQAGARARRSAVHRRNDTRRIPQVHRKRFGARAALPKRDRQSALAGRGHRDSQRSARQIRSASPRHDYRHGADRSGEAQRPLHHRPLPAGQSHRRDRRIRLARAPQQDDAPAGPQGHGTADRRTGDGEGAGRRRAGLRNRRGIPRQSRSAAQPDEEDSEGMEGVVVRNSRHGGRRSRARSHQQNDRHSAAQDAGRGNRAPA